MEDGNESASVRCRFVTALPDIRVTSDPFSVPVRLGRKGLSDVINHLLGAHGASAGRLFDFLVYDPVTADGASDERQPVTPQYMRSASKKLLRRSLRNHLNDNGVSTERLVTVEYAPSLPRPTGGGSTEAPDWVGSLAGASLLGSVASPKQVFVAGCYDGHLRLYDSASAAPYGSGGVRGHEGAVKALAVAGSFVVSGGQDKAVRTWDLQTATGNNSSSGGGGPILAPLGLGESGGGASRLAHENSVECVAARLEGDGTASVLSGDWDGRICLWRCQTSASGADNDEATSMQEGEGSSDPALKKRRGASSIRSGSSSDTAVTSSSSSSLASLTPTSAWKAHAHCVSAAAWMSTGDDDDGSSGSGSGGGSSMGVSASAVTASWDHSIKTWDVERQDCIATINGSKVNTCLAYGGSGGAAGAGVIATGHPDGVVRMWDPRVPASNSSDGSAAFSVGCLSSTETLGGWVSDVAWCPGHPTLLAAASHDGALRLLDVRSPKPLFTLRAHGTKGTPLKGLSVGWSGSTVASGGADCQLKTFGLDGLGL